ncbi:phage tail tape measure protein, partial [Enterobacter hormaechei]|uniref:phage tail tape measure protein n=1 Tax=Enterobacter hormaechei TaxID=158836 RepID=UPI0023E4258F
LDGDFKNLDGAWEGFRIQINDLVNNQLRALTQGLSNVVGNMTQWAKENPKHSHSLLVVAGSVLALTATIGGTSLAVGLLMGPLAKLQLGFTLVTGGRGIAGTIAALRTLGTASGPAMASVRGWGPVLGSLAGKMRGVSTIIPSMRGALMGVFLAPGAALGALTKNLGMLALRLTGLPVI